MKIYRQHNVVYNPGTLKMTLLLKAGQQAIHPSTLLA
jgi:hypothetical protein